jgi:hypothetical protein
LRKREEREGRLGRGGDCVGVCVCVWGSEGEGFAAALAGAEAEAEGGVVDGIGCLDDRILAISGARTLNLEVVLPVGGPSGVGLGEGMFVVGGLVENVIDACSLN